MVLALAGLVTVGLIVSSRAASTASTIQRQSTPPSVVELRPNEAAVGAMTADEGAPEAETSQPGEAQQIDTQPARDAVASAGLTYQAGVGVWTGVSEVVQGGAAVTGLTDATTEPINILLMGVDARPGESIDIGVRPDSLAVLRLDPESGSCRMLRIPRDSRVELPGYGLTKINHALAVGGIPYQELVVEEFLGIPIDQYALIDFGGVEALVDATGGVTITITDTFTVGEHSFSPGERTLTGPEALAYSRYRYGPDGDFGRIRRQQDVLRALLSQAGETEPQVLLQKVLPLLQDHVRTDLTIADLVSLADRFRTTCTEDSLVTLTLEGTVATFEDPLFGMSLSYVVIDPDEVSRKVEELLVAG